MRRLTTRTDLTTWTDEELRLRLDIEVAKFNKYRLSPLDKHVGMAIEAEMAAAQLGGEIRRRRGLAK